MKEANEHKGPLEITNHLDRLSPGDVITVVSSEQCERAPFTREVVYDTVFPSLEGPLRLGVRPLNQIDAPEGYLLFAGSTEGIYQILDGHGVEVFCNPNIPFPYFLPGQIDLIRDPEAMAKRQVALGLYPDIESLMKATGEDLRPVDE